MYFPDTIARIGEGNGYQMSIHPKKSVDAVMDNISLERVNIVVPLYIRRDAYLEES